MSCDISEKVSLLIDGELAAWETEQVRKHLSVCRVCSQMERDFLALRDQIRSFELEADPMAQKQALSNVLGSQRVPLWRRRIAMPAPVFALVVVVVLSLCAWVLLVVGRRSPAADVRAANAPAQPQRDQPTQGAIDLSRYDRGERAVIYKVHRAQ
jgi:Putative zinc-finger